MDAAPQPPRPQQPLPQQPVEDLFANTLHDESIKQQRQPSWVSQPTQPSAAVPPLQEEHDNRSPEQPRFAGGDTRIPRRTRYALIGTSIMAVLVIGFVYGSTIVQRFTGSKQNDTITNINQVRPITNATIPSNRTNRQVHVTVVDADGDGLTDEEEKTLGTDLNSVDTDNDGLTDRQETQIYTTNPKDDDSDHDGYTDGEEVKSFYNPNGSGRLLNVNEAITNFANSNTNQ